MRWCKQFFRRYCLKIKTAGMCHKTLLQVLGLIESFFKTGLVTWSADLIESVQFKLCEWKCINEIARLKLRDWNCVNENMRLKLCDWNCEIEIARMKLHDWNCAFENLWMKMCEWICATEIERLKLCDWNCAIEIAQWKLHNRNCRIETVVCISSGADGRRSSVPSSVLSSRRRDTCRHFSQTSRTATPWLETCVHTCFTLKPKFHLDCHVSTWHDTFDISSVSSRAVRQARHSQNAWVDMLTVLCRVERWSDKQSGIWASLNSIK